MKKIILFIGIVGFISIMALPLKSETNFTNNTLNINSISMIEVADSTNKADCKKAEEKKSCAKSEAKKEDCKKAEEKPCDKK